MGKHPPELDEEAQAPWSISTRSCWRLEKTQRISLLTGGWYISGVGDRQGGEDVYSSTWQEAFRSTKESGMSNSQACPHLAGQVHQLPLLTEGGKKLCLKL